MLNAEDRKDFILELYLEPYIFYIPYDCYISLQSNFDLNGHICAPPGLFILKLHPLIAVKVWVGSYINNREHVKGKKVVLYEMEAKSYCFCKYTNLHAIFNSWPNLTLCQYLNYKTNKKKQRLILTELYLMVRISMFNCTATRCNLLKQTGKTFDVSVKDGPPLIWYINII